MKKTSQIFLILSFIFCTTAIEIAAQTCAPVPSGAVSWYRAENNALDSQGANHGTLQGGAGFAAGQVGQAFSLNGTSGFVSAPSSAANSVTGSFTIEAWVRLNAYSPEFTPIVSKWNDITTGNRSYFLAVSSTGRLQLFVGTNNGFLQITSNSVVVPLNQFTHVASVFDASAQTMRLYMNGIEIGQAGGASTVLASNEPLLIGAGDLGSNVRDFTNGLIDEATLYNRALSASEILAIFNAGSAGKCFAPTAASVTVNGRVFNAQGRSIKNARIHLTDQNGVARTVLTNAFGYYRFDEVAAGESYVFTILHKQFEFEPLVLLINEERSDLNFTALSPK